MSHSYPSDISREQFARILPTLESARRRTKPRTVDLYDVFCGVLYLLKSGCQWRMLPADFDSTLSSATPCWSSSASWVWAIRCHLRGPRAGGDLPPRPAGVPPHGPAAPGTARPANSRVRQVLLQA